MQAADETDVDACRANDFALVRIAAADRASVNPSLPFCGGPTGLAVTIADGATVHTYGNSSLRPGDGSAKTGVKSQQEDGGWTHRISTPLNPGAPGDSGSAFIGPEGGAIGVLSTLEVLPDAGSNGVSDLSRMLAYMADRGGPAVTSAPGTLVFADGEEASKDCLDAQSPDGDPSPATVFAAAGTLADRDGDCDRPRGFGHANAEPPRRRPDLRRRPVGRDAHRRGRGTVAADRPRHAPRRGGRSPP